ncbi:hypothetical protein AC1031_010196 [Aphanomyces cochlioides]|nr:hypothetical protein AC1031_010196 [Aphanomyces cochlioides]
MTTAAAAVNLFTPLTIGRGSIQVANRIFLAPLTRQRASATHVPNALMKEYYTQRATGGLLFTESNMILPHTSAFVTEPGVYTQEQLLQWKDIVDAVHAKGSKIICQLWHPGRAAHPDNNDGHQGVAPSAIAIDGETHTTNGKAPNVQPRELGMDELPAIVQAFATAAKNCIDVAGFDGVEITAANGYLIDQFLSDGSNKRTDIYGGSLENRTRFVKDVLATVTATVGSDKVGVRFSPLNSYNSTIDSDPAALSQPSRRSARTWISHIVPIFREHFKKTLVVNLGYTKEEVTAGVAQGLFDAVAFGMPYIANPDLPARFATNAALNPPDFSTFHTTEAKGYTDYPFLP